MKSPRIGDIVRLRSGSPPMTVLTLVQGGECLCGWVRVQKFSKLGDHLVLGAETFPAETLVRDDDLSPERSK